MRVLGYMLVALVACRVEEQQFTALGGGDAGSNGSGADAAIPMRSFALDGVGSAVLWTGTQLLVTDTGDGLRTGTANGLTTTISLLGNSSASEWAGLLVLLDGSTIVTDANATPRMVEVSSSGTSNYLTGGTHHREGLAAGPQETWEVYWDGSGSAITGHLATLAINGTSAIEMEQLTGTVNPQRLTGVLTQDASDVYIADQTTHTISSVNIALNTSTTIAAPPTVDQLCQLPGGDLLTGGGPLIYRITAGTATPLPFGPFNEVRGIAYDPTDRLLFAIDHDPSGAGSDFVRVLDFIP